MIGVEAIDPGIHLDRVHDTPACHIGARLGDTRSLPGVTLVQLGFCLRAVGTITRGWNGIHGR